MLICIAKRCIVEWRRGRKWQQIMNKEECQLIACSVIANAGSAYDCFISAVKEADKGAFEAAENLMKNGDEYLLNAHRAQTDLLNAEMRGGEIPIGILMVHAQDHFMHAMTYKQSAADLIRLYKKMEGVKE